MKVPPLGGGAIALLSSVEMNHEPRAQTLLDEPMAANVARGALLPP